MGSHAPSSTDDDGEAFGPDAPVGIEHVHGLGVDPDSGVLYVATHFGVHSISDESKVERLGDTYQDTMGFTVVGPSHFLGSGHPDVAGIRAGQPGPLGLIESTDGGETWEMRSLAGDADFHALALVHGMTYGWDSGTGRFLVSGDGDVWDERSVVDLTSFAVSPEDPDRIVAAMRDGVGVSDDGGRAWSAVASVPIAVLLWAPDGAVWGIERSGRVHRSDDAGQSWSSVADVPGAPQALLATDDALWAAVAADDGPTTIVRSTDGGMTWDTWYRDEAPDE